MLQRGRVGEEGRGKGGGVGGEEAAGEGQGFEEGEVEKRCRREESSGFAGWNRGDDFRFDFDGNNVEKVGVDSVATDAGPWSVGAGARMELGPGLVGEKRGEDDRERSVLCRRHCIAGGGAGSGWKQSNGVEEEEEGGGHGRE